MTGSEDKPGCLDKLGLTGLKAVEMVHMKKGIPVLYYITVIISALVGVWHFLCPGCFGGTIIYLHSMKIS